MKAKTAEQMLKESLRLAGIKQPKTPINVGINPYNYVSESAEFDHKGSQLVMEAALMESVFGKISNFFKSDYKDVKYAFFANKTGDVLTVVGNNGKFEVVELIGSKARSNKFANASDLTKFLAVKITQGFELKKKQLDIKGVMKQIGKGLLAVMGIIAFGFGAYYLVSAYGAAAIAMGLRIPSFLGNIMDKITGTDSAMVTKELELPPQVVASLTDAEAKIMDAKEKSLDFLRQYEQSVLAVSKQNDANEKSGIGQLAVGVGKSKEEIEAAFLPSIRPRGTMRNTFVDTAMDLVNPNLNPLEKLSQGALATLLAPYAAVEAATKNVEYAINSDFGANPPISPFTRDDTLVKAIDGLKNAATNEVPKKVKELVGLLDTKATEYQQFLQSKIPADAMGSSIPKTTVRFDDVTTQTSNAVKTVANTVTDTSWITRIASDATRIATMISREQAMRNAGKPVTPNTTLDDVMVGP